jgi:hypothetical protein
VFLTVNTVPGTGLFYHVDYNVHVHMAAHARRRIRSLRRELTPREAFSALGWFLLILVAFIFGLFFVFTPDSDERALFPSRAPEPRLDTGSGLPTAK